MTPRQSDLRRLLTVIDITLMLVGAVVGSWALVVIGVVNLAGLWAGEASRFLDS